MSPDSWRKVGIRRLFDQWVGGVDCWCKQPVIVCFRGASVDQKQGPSFFSKELRKMFTFALKESMWCWTFGCVASMFALGDHIWVSYGGDRVYLSSFDRDVYLSSTPNPIYRPHPSPIPYIHHDILQKRIFWEIKAKSKSSFDRNYQDIIFLKEIPRPDSHFRFESKGRVIYVQ